MYRESHRRQGGCGELMCLFVASLICHYPERSPRPDQRLNHEVAVDTNLVGAVD